MTQGHWIYDDDAAFEARLQRYRAELQQWRARQELRPTDWGSLLVLLGSLLCPVALVLPYAFIGTGVQPSTVIAGMIGLAVIALAIITAGIPMATRYQAADPKPSL